MNPDCSKQRPLPGVLRATEIVQAGRVLEWLKSYVSAPHPDLGRSGPICPFVPVSMKADSLEFAIHSDIDGTEPAAIRGLLENYLTYLTATVPRSPTLRRRRGLVVVLPNIEPDRLHVLDEVHAEIKSHMVHNGLMLGQFHSRCPDVAVRNASFRVSIAPVPCFALRYMAPHDILFLHDRQDWFVLYRQRYAEEYRAGRIHDPMMLRLYHTAESNLEDQ